MAAVSFSAFQATAVASLAWAALVPMRRRQGRPPCRSTASTLTAVIALPSTRWTASGVLLLWILFLLSPDWKEARTVGLCVPSALLWRVVATALSCWTALATPETSAFSRGGPLGLGCYKLWESLVGTVLCRFLSAKWNLSMESSSTASPYCFLSLGKPIPSQPWTVWLCVVALCLAVNGILWLWSLYHTGRRRSSANKEGADHAKAAPSATFDHPGVAQMVEGSLGRSLTSKEHAQLAGLALLNAACEEASYRGVCRWFFVQVLPSKSPLMWHSNFCQAAVFGIWHYHGIPSGLVGVALTFVYGIVMGILADYNDGLGLAIVAHTLADYFIFATIARQQQSLDKQA